MDRNTYTLLYNINKTLSESGEYCSKSGCSFNGDFLDSDGEKKPISRKKLENLNTNSENQNKNEHDENIELDNEHHYGPVLGSNLVSGN